MNLQLNLTTDYAIRSLLYLAIKKVPTTSTEISDTMQIPPSYQLTIMSKLKKAGFISAMRGNNGGYSLTKPPCNISLLDIIEVMEGTTRINRCLEDDQFCSRFATENCPVRNVYCAMQKAMEEGFRKVTLESLQEQL